MSSEGHPCCAHYLKTHCALFLYGIKLFRVRVDVSPALSCHDHAGVQRVRMPWQRLMGAEQLSTAENVTRG